MSALTLQTIGTRISKWGEGPIWWNDKLIYVDIEGHQLISLDPATGKEQVWDVGERIGTVVPHTSGGFLYAGDSGIIAFDPTSGTKQNLADPEPEKRATNRFNDGKCDPAGRFWAGTISLVKNIGDAALYMLDTDGALHLKVDEVTNSNGICWNAGATKMYYIDTMTKQIRAYDYDNASAGDTEAAKICVGILERIAKINGVIPDRSLVTVDQRAMKFDQPVTFKIDPGVTGIDELANMPHDARLDGGSDQINLDLR